MKRREDVGLIQARIPIGSKHTKIGGKQGIDIIDLVFHVSQLGLDLIFLSGCLPSHWDIE